LIVITGWEGDFKSMGFDFRVLSTVTRSPQFSNPASSEINQNPIEADAFSLGRDWFSSVIYRSHILEVGLQAEDVVKCWRKIQSREIHQLRHVPSACAPDRAGVAELAAASACLHNKSLAAWLALHVFVNASHINWVMTLMLSAD
jgi:hypothetical protein